MFWSGSGVALIALVFLFFWLPAFDAVVAWFSEDAPLTQGQRSGLEWYFLAFVVVFAAWVSAAGFFVSLELIRRVVIGIWSVVLLVFLTLAFFLLPAWDTSSAYLPSGMALFIFLAFLTAMVWAVGAATIWGLVTVAEWVVHRVAWHRQDRLTG